MTHHVLDALAVLPHLPDAAAQRRLRVLDVGSGGGVPAIPLAIARPQWHVVALDSNHKKGAFLQQAVNEIPLPNAEAVVARVEDYVAVGAFRHRHLARLFRSRDVRRVERAASRADGVLVAMKGVFPDEEIALLPSTVRVVATPALAVPGLDAERHLS